MTARDAPEEKVRPLDLGADDYLVKPFALGELLARLRVQLRQQTAGRVLCAGPLALHLGQHRALCYERERSLTPVEFHLLAVLMEQPGKVLSRQQLGQLVWRKRFSPGSNVIEVHMATLRAKLRELGCYGLLRTVRGLSYAIRACLTGGDGRAGRPTRDRLRITTVPRCAISGRVRCPRPRSPPGGTGSYSKP